MIVSGHGWLPAAGERDIDFSAWDDAAYAESLRQLGESGWGPEALDGYQLEGAAFLASRVGGLLSDEMGLGKTRCALAAVRLLGLTRVLVVCPAGVRFSWRDECATFWDARCSLPDDEAELDGTAPLTIAAYSRLAALAPGLRRMRFQAVIFDEAQYVKNDGDTSDRSFEDGKSTHRTAAAFYVARNIRRVYLLSGTPMLSRPRDLFNLLRITRHPLGRDYTNYALQFCAGQVTRFGIEANGASNGRALALSLLGWNLGRRKAQVMPGMPSKKSTLHKVSLPEATMKQYRRAWTDYLTELRKLAPLSRLRSALRGQHLTKLQQFRLFLSKAKAPIAYGLAEKHDGKTIVATAFKDSLKILVKLAPKDSFVIYHGGLTEKQRDAAVRRFQTDPRCRYFFCTVEPAKTGITLTAASQVVSVDFVWTPSDHKQLEDRAHRRGQTRDVISRYIYCPDTIDEQTVGLLAHKTTMIGGVFAQGGESGRTAEAESQKDLIVAAVAAIGPRTANLPL